MADLGLYSLLLLATFQSAVAITLWVPTDSQSIVKQVVWKHSSWITLFLATLMLVALEYALVTEDFSVAFVAAQTSSDLPILYKVAALWAGHEGSMVLWIWIMATTVFVWQYLLGRDNSNTPFNQTVLGSLVAIVACFAWYTLITSNPFERLLPLAPGDGQDLNPLLQDIALGIHPPILYAGYISTLVPWALAVAMLRHRQIDVPTLQIWTYISWATLTLGIALGSWWAYRELGWGGWWFWDPVENLSVLPWLIVTALAHSLRSNTQKTMRNWVIVLASLGFVLSILGSFAVRSGLLVSVHNFANDPGRGLFLLVILAITSLPLLALPFVRFQSQSVEPISRQGLLLANVLVMMVLAVTIGFATLFPLFWELLQGQVLLVGAPFFEQVVPLIAGVGLGIVLVYPWVLRDYGATKIVAGISLCLIAVLIPAPWGSYALATLALFGTAIGLGIESTKRYRQKTLTLSWLRMSIGHFCFGIFVAAAAIDIGTHELHELVMKPGDVFEIAGIELQMQPTASERASNYTVDRVPFVAVGQSEPLTLLAEKRYYPIRGTVLSEAATSSGLLGDIHVALGERVGVNDGQDRWTVRMQFRPLVKWVWLSALALVLAILTLGLLPSISAGTARTTSGILAKTSLIANNKGGDR